MTLRLDFTVNNANARSMPDPHTWCLIIQEVVRGEQEFSPYKLFTVPLFNHTKQLSGVLGLDEGDSKT